MKQIIITILFTLLLNHPATLAQCLARLDDDSEIAANTEENINATFRFDYKVKSDVEIFSDGIVKRYNIDYYVNTADGSMFFPRGFFISNYGSYSNEKGHIDGSVWMSNGQMVTYVYDKRRDKKRAVTVQTNKTYDEVNARQYLNMMQFFRRIGELSASSEPLPESFEWDGITEAYTGPIPTEEGSDDHTMTVHFDARPTDIKTNRILVGFLVGVLKDAQIKKCNRLAVFTKIELHGSSDYLQGELLSIKKESKTFSGAGYKTLNLGGTAGSDIHNMMREFRSKGSALMLEKNELVKKKKRCPDRDEVCRERYRKAIEEIDEKMKKLECEMAKAMGTDDMMEDCY